ncbi:large ribosomal subunit protein eL42-like [Physella acuta]|uniref:large ribosomal subunit protein eL42-like n=1 Tax=Physella acuta TaxID=109671 RepID=UPI0027DE3BA1|nr:large ribosomal subunit protein eL42-like [Physella acuta]
MVNIPKTRRTHCKRCNKHTEHKTTQYKRSKERSLALGRRRYDRKQAGFKGRTRPKLKKKAKTSKKIVLRLECKECGIRKQLAIKRSKRLELGGDLKRKDQVPTF